MDFKLFIILLINMLKKRIIASINIMNNIVVQSIGFNKYLPVGNLDITLDFLNKWGADEIVIFDISARSRNKINYRLLNKINNKNFVPICYGGGINNVHQIRKLINNFSDKVSLNYSLLQNMKLLKDATDKFGKQCIVGSVDIIRNNKQKYFVFDSFKKKVTNLDPIDYCKELSENGIGEIILKLVNNDGMKCGYEIIYYNKIIKAVNSPVIISSGIGTYKQLIKGFDKCNASGYAVGNFLHFKEHNLTIMKNILNKKSKKIRDDNNFRYKDHFIKPFLSKIYE